MYVPVVVTLDLIDARDGDHGRAYELLDAHFLLRRQLSEVEGEGDTLPSTTVFGRVFASEWSGPEQLQEDIQRVLEAAGLRPGRVFVGELNHWTAWDKKAAWRRLMQRLKAI